MPFVLYVFQESIVGIQKGSIVFKLTQLRLKPLFRASVVKPKASLHRNRARAFVAGGEFALAENRGNGRQGVQELLRRASRRG